MKKSFFLHIVSGILLLSSAIIPSKVSAQLVSLFTQYSDLQTFVNPGSMPNDFLQYQQKMSAGLTYRSQWVGIEGSPNTALGRFDYTLEDNNLSSLGGFLLSDRVGASTVNGVYGRYSYQIRPSVQEDMFIGIGILAGMLQYTVRASELEFKTDDQLQGDRVNRWIPDFGIGANFVAYPQRGMKFYAGVSLPQVASLGAKFEARDGTREFIFRRPIHLLGTMGFTIPVGQQGFIEPSLWIKQTKNQPVNVDFNVRQKFINNFWLGAGYGTSKTIHVEGGIILSETLGLPEGLIRVGYGFDYNISGFGANLGATHEINISYAFGSTKR